MRAITNSDYRAHNAPLFSNLEILDVFQVNTLDIAKFMLHYLYNLLPPLFLNLFQTVKFTAMTQEQPVIIECIPVVRTSRNSQFFAKDLESGTVFLHCITNLSSFSIFKNKVLAFLFK